MKRFLATVLLASQLSSCVAWRAQQMSPQEVLARKPQSVIRVTTNDDPKGIVVHQPRIVNDTLVGHPTEDAIQRLMIPVGSVTQVSTRYRHVGKSLLAGLAVLGGVAIYGLLQELNGTSP